MKRRSRQSATLKPLLFRTGERMDRRTFLGTGTLAALGLALPGRGMAQSSRRGQPSLLPVPLNPGDTVGLVSPSGATDDSMTLQLAREAMEALGLKVKMGEHAFSRNGHLAGTDAERAGDLNAMFGDRDVRAIICVRGGSGVARLLPLLDYDRIRRNPKIVLGFSDITALHCALQAKTGLVTFHGPNGGGSWNTFNADQFRRLFFERELMEYRNKMVAGDELLPRRNRTMAIRPGKAHGGLVGGNLAVLTALAGSSYLPAFDGKILFLEDVSEAPYRIDRMMSTLKLMGALDRISGFVWGECSDCNPGGGYGSLTIEQILDHYIRPLKIPAYRGAMIGHIREQFILPVGGEVEMDADAGTMRMLQPVFAAG